MAAPWTGPRAGPLGCITDKRPAREWLCQCADPAVELMVSGLHSLSSPETGAPCARSIVLATSQKHSHREARRPKQVKLPPSVAGDGLIAKAGTDATPAGKKRA